MKHMVRAGLDNNVKFRKPVQADTYFLSLGLAKKELKPAKIILKLYR